MNTVLITGAGGAATPQVIRHLQDLGYRVLAADMDQGAAGLYVADKGFVIPAGGSEDFVPTLHRICWTEGVRALLPLVDEELIPAWDLERPGMAVVLPGREFIETCLDKWALMCALDFSGISVPLFVLGYNSLSALRPPYIVKPRTGRGSRGVTVCQTVDEVHTAIWNLKPPYDKTLVQEYKEGTEYTVSVVVGRDGMVQAVVPKQIIQKRGITQRAVTRRVRVIDEVCRQIQDRLEANGPFNLQCIVDKNGKVWPFEINPRFSTSTTLTRACGVDEIGELVAQALGSPPKDLNDWQEGVVMIRQTVDQFEDEATYLRREIVG